MKKGLRNIIKWTASLGLALLLLGFANADRNSSRCWKFDVEVEHLSGLYFIDDASVRAQILDMGDPIIGSRIDSIDIDQIRRSLMALPSVNEAQVYTSVDGCLSVKVTQRTPLFRVINKTEGSYYIDTEGERMPLSMNYTARVPVITGEINIPFAKGASSETKEALLHTCLSIIRSLESDPFWSAQAEHLYINKSGDVVLVPRVGRAHIVLGNEKDMEDKLLRLKAFYLDMSHKNNLNKYKRINVKFRDQVVCERYF